MREILNGASKIIAEEGEYSVPYEIVKDSREYLNDYLKDLTYHVDNYKSTCLDYNKNELYIKIELQKKNESTITYTIPLKINDTCN